MTTKVMLKVCSVVTLVPPALIDLGPAKWKPRSGLGWEIDHFAGYFVITVMCCLAWPRPPPGWGSARDLRGLLEGLHAFMPDRSSYYLAALYSAAGVVAAAILLISLYGHGDGSTLSE